MKRLTLILPLLIAMLLSSCQNDGYIGEIFGTWRVESYTRDGVEMKIGPTTFSFQNNIVNCVLNVDEYGTSWGRFGTWTLTDRQFELNFTHHDDNTPQGSGIYEAPEWLGMISDEVMNMKITLNKDKMIWMWNAPDGAICVYQLHKTW